MRILFACLAVLAASGCASTKAVDSTRLAEAMFRAESNVTYTVLPGKAIGLPDSTLAIPTVPGKDVRFRATRPDGLSIELDTSRSGVLDAALLGLTQVDAAKFAADAATREWIMQIMDRAIEVALPLIQQRMDAPPAAPRPSRADQVRDLLTDPEVRAALRDLLGGAK